MCVHAYMGMCICVYVHAWVYVHTCVCSVYIYMCVYMCICSMCVCTCMNVCVPVEARIGLLDPLEVVVESHLMLVLETELWSFGRTASASNN